MPVADALEGVDGLLLTGGERRERRRATARRRMRRLVEAEPGRDEFEIALSPPRASAICRSSRSAAASRC